MKTLLKLLNILRSQWSHVIVTISLLCLGFFFMNYEKLGVSINEFNLIDLLYSKSAILFLAFLFISLSMCLLNYTGYKTFNRETVNNYICGFSTAIATPLAYSIYIITAKIYSALHFEEPRDLIYKGPFFNVNRLGTYEELEATALKLAEQMGVSLSKDELSSLCLEKTNITELVAETQAFCLKKLQSSSAVVEESGGGAYFFNIINATSTFVSDNKLLSLSLALVVGLGAYALFQNYNVNVNVPTIQVPVIDVPERTTFGAFYQRDPMTGKRMIDAAIDVNNENTSRIVAHVDSLSQDVETYRNSVEYCEKALNVIFEIVEDNRMGFQIPYSTAPTQREKCAREALRVLMESHEVV